MVRPTGRESEPSRVLVTLVQGREDKVQKIQLNQEVCGRVPGRGRRRGAEDGDRGRLKKTRKWSRETRTLVRLDPICIADDTGEEPALIERIAHLVRLQPQAAIELYGARVNGQISWGKKTTPRWTTLTISSPCCAHANVS